MPTGFCLFGERRLGGGFTSSGREASLRELYRDADEVKGRGVAVGVGLDRLAMEYFFIPETDDRKIEAALELQKEFRQHGGNDQAAHHYLSRKSARGAGILSLTLTESAGLPAQAAVFPIHAALYALAWQRGLISSQTNTLIIGFVADQVISLAAEGEDIVFLRDFPRANLNAMTIVTAAQSVYFRKQRGLIAPDRILLVGTASDFAAVTPELPAGAERHELDTAGWFADRELDAVERTLLVLSWGIALAAKVPAIADWNVRGRRGPAWRQSKWYLVRTALLLLAGLPAIFAAEYICNRILIRQLDARAEAFAPLYRRVSQDLDRIDQMRNFARRTGRNMIGPDICYEVFQAVNKARPDNLWFSSISGNPYRKFILTGIAPDYPTMLGFLDKLDKEKIIADYQLISAGMDSRGRVDFRVDLKYKFDPAFTAPSEKEDEEE